jgi:hypothetical protein
MATHATANAAEVIARANRWRFANSIVSASPSKSATTFCAIIAASRGLLLSLTSTR